MSAQFHNHSQSHSHSQSADGVKTYIDRNGDTVQESSGPVPIFRGLAAAGGEAFISDSESEEDHHSHAAHYIPAASEKKSKKSKKEKKSKKDRSGSSSSGHACTCGHSHH